MAKVQFTLSIGYISASRKEVVDMDFEGMSQDEIEEEIDEAWKEWAWNYIDGGPHIIEE